MNNQYPLITIIITTYNCELNIENTILSAINQSYKNIEIIIVDDNSSDQTMAICSKYEDQPNIKIIKNNFFDKNRIFKGVNINAGYSSRNLGIKFARGEWISFIDGGDYIHKSKIEIQLKIAQKYKCLHIISEYNTFDSKKIFPKNISYIEYDIDQIKIQTTKELMRVLKRQKDLLANIPLIIRKRIPYFIRQSFKLRSFIYPKPMDPFPGCGPSVFFHKTVKIRYRPLNERRWSSSKGRGADRDFNFSILEFYKSSIFIKESLYYWGI